MEKVFSKTVTSLLLAGAMLGGTIVVNSNSVHADTTTTQSQLKKGIALGSPENYLNKGQAVDKYVKVINNDNAYSFSDDLWDDTDYLTTLKGTTMSIGTIGNVYHVTEEYTSAQGILYYRIQVGDQSYVVSSGATEQATPNKKYDGKLFAYYTDEEYKKSLGNPIDYSHFNDDEYDKAKEHNKKMMDMESEHIDLISQKLNSGDNATNISNGELPNFEDSIPDGYISTGKVGIMVMLKNGVSVGNTVDVENLSTNNLEKMVDQSIQSAENEQANSQVSDNKDVAMIVVSPYITKTK